MTIRRCALLAFGLIAVGVFACSGASAQVKPMADCSKPSSNVGHYLDLAQWQRDANRELLRSLRTGKPINWVRAYCGALHEFGRPVLSRVGEHHHAAPHPAKAARHPRPELRHATSLGARHPAPAVAAPPLSKHTSRAKKPAPGRPPKASGMVTSATRPAAHPSSSSSSGPAGRPQPTAFTSLDETSRTGTWNLLRVLPLLLVAAPLLFAFACRGRLQCAAALSWAGVVRLRPGLRREATASSGLDLFELSGLALTGPGAASAARGIAIAMLTRWTAGLIEVVMTRADARSLLGLDLDESAGEQIPGLVLTDDFFDAKTYLRTPGPRRLFVSCSTGLDLLHELLICERGHIAAISLSPWLHDTIEVAAGGRINEMAPLPTLTRPEAYAQLMKLPTARKPTLLEARTSAGVRPPT